MSKYIVKNCPCFNDGHPELRFSGECLDLTQAENDCCIDCTNCLIKQVIDKCRKHKEWFSKLPDGVAFNLKTFTGGNLQDEILQLFEIEECE